MRRTTTHPVLPWMQLALKTGEMLAASSQVIPLRLGRMAAAGHRPSPRDRREFARMGPEKLQAGAESLWAVGLALQQMQLRWWMQLWQPWLRGSAGLALAGSQAARLSSAALAPIHRTATANARRLTRVKARTGAGRR
jgi:hypothetical protein